MSKLIVVAGVASALAFFAATGWFVTHSRGQAKSSAESAALERLNGKVARLEQLLAAEQQRDKRTVNVTQLVAAPASSGEQAVVDPGPASPEDEAAEEAQRQAAETRQREERQARLDGMLATEPADPNWSRSTVNEIRDWMTHPKLSKFKLEGVECRSSLCRIELSVEPGSNPHDFFSYNSAALAKFEDGTAHLVRDPNGGAHLVTYIGRKGQPLPE